VYTSEPINQKWNGIAQHISAFILNGTDNIVLTLFSTLSNVSIYSVYHLVVYGVHQLYQSATLGIHALVGELWAKQEINQLNHVFGIVELVLHFSTVFLFSCTGILILPFVRVYTDGITDANYIQPLFAVLIVLAHASQCIKTTYNILIMAGGHYKQTQKCYIISAVLNLTISIVTVYFLGLVGVAIGTVVAMVYQMVWMAYYDSKHLLKWPFSNFIKQIVIDILTVSLIWIATSWIQLGSITYIAWFLMAIEVALIALLITVAMAFIFHHKKMTEVFKHIMRRKNKV
jgi:O-antigen/teichoic acid export membrane protein